MSNLPHVLVGEGRSLRLCNTASTPRVFDLAPSGAGPAPDSTEAVSKGSPAI